MTFIESVKKCYSKFASIEGRASRSEYWWFSLYYWLTILFFGCGLALSIESKKPLGYIFAFLGGIGFISSMIPAITVRVRRLHDCGRSGWWVLAQAIPYVGYVIALINFIYTLAKGDKGINRYGEDPLKDCLNYYNINENKNNSPLLDEKKDNPFDSEILRIEDSAEKDVLNSDEDGINEDINQKILKDTDFSESPSKNGEETNDWISL